MNDRNIVAISARLEQEEILESSLGNGDGPWTIISDSWHHDDGCYGGRYVALSLPELRDRILSHAGWDLTKGRGVPGFSGSDTDAEYFRIDSAPDFEPLVIYQEFHNVVPDTVLISEEFRLLMNLWLDPKSGNYLQIGDDGSKELAIRFTGRKVEVRTPILRRYLAARQLDATLFVDSTVSMPTTLPSEVFKNLEIEDFSNHRDMLLSRNIGERRLSGHDEVYSRVLAKRILLAPTQETCGIWPWDTIQAAEYPEFIIEENESGGAIRFTCNPDLLKNHFGANPEAPEYLTPVFFRPEVLQKYYNDSSLYEVRDGYLSCAQKWGARIDNDNPELVAVFLGDIGRDIPQSHWAHWLSHNVPPTQNISETYVRRSFFGQPVDSRNPEHRFKTLHRTLNQVWEQHWGWPLFRRATSRDADVIKRLRVPLNDTDAELREQLLNLALVLVDLLNEKGVTQALPHVGDKKGISKFETFLRGYSYEFTDRDISLLRRIQRMRSKIAAHASGESGQQLLHEELGELTPQKYFGDLLTSATQMMRDLIRFTELHAFNGSPAPGPSLGS